MLRNNNWPVLILLVPVPDGDFDCRKQSGAVPNESSYKSAKEFLEKMDAGDLDGDLITEVQKLTGGRHFGPLIVSGLSATRTKVGTSGA
jgi:hypothetical protein